MLFGSNGNIQPNTEDVLSTEDQALIFEAAILESLTGEELTAFLESHNEVNAAIRDEVLLEKSIVRLDKKAKTSQAQKMAVFTIAKEKNDPKLKKLLTVWRMERLLEMDLFKKYGNEGLRRAKKAVGNGQKSKSALVKKVANNVNKSLNGPAKR
jgi:hypothetical protein